jgi:putative peptidoglycan lipid II flippase
VSTAAAVGLGRPALTISAWNAVSRATGFVRVLAVGAALGTTFLGNTYQSANLVSNLLFEVLAAGLVSAPLVPAFVGFVDRGRRQDAERLAGSLLGLVLVGLGVVVAVLALGRHGVMRLLTAGVDDPAVRAAQVRLGAFLLWFFLPQVLLYAVGAVASALLNAERRFAAAAMAPVANNVVVTATMVAFMVVRPGPPSLALAGGEKLLLALGTTGGVLAMVAVPLVVLRRAGVRLRPRFDLAAPGLRAVARTALWGGVLLAVTQVLVGVTLVLANPVEGGVVAYQIAFTFFLLPFALVAHPVMTAVYPALSAHAHAERWDDFATAVRSGLGRVLLLVVPAAALLAALAEPVLGAVRLGAVGADDAAFVGRVLAGYALGLAGYSAFQLSARAFTALGDARVPALVGVAVTAFGVVAMAVGASLVDGRDRVVALGVAHSLAVTAGAVVLHVLLGRRLERPLGVGPALARGLGAGLGAFAVARGVVAVVGTGGDRSHSVLTLAFAGPAAAALAGVVLWPVLRPRPA